MLRQRRMGLNFKKAVWAGWYFDNPKPVEFVKNSLQLGTHETAIVLDFFSGSATTAHAVMQLNAEDGGHRKFIMVQLPEKCDEKSRSLQSGLQKYL